MLIKDIKHKKLCTDYEHGYTIICFTSFLFYKALQSISSLHKNETKPEK